MGYGNHFTGAVGEDALSLSTSLCGRGRSGESKKPWREMQPGLEMMDRIMMKVASQLKMSLFQKEVVHLRSHEIWGPGILGKLVASGLLYPLALLKYPSSNILISELCKIRSSKEK